MQVILRNRCLIISRNSINYSTTQFSFLHSTPFCNDKWKNKWTSEFKGGQQQSKKQARFVIRQKRADQKKALWSLLSNYGASGIALQNDQRSSKGCGTSGWNGNSGNHSDSSKKKGQAKTEYCRAEKIHNHRMRRKFRKGYLSEDDDDYPETLFEATFGNRWYTWSFNSQKSSPEFKRRESFYHTRNHQKEWGTSNEPDFDNEAFSVGSRSDRAVLGLPQIGPLKLKDVKNAFHLSALKWHPDKHQGSAQAAAEEKFKLCVSAYKSLCSALSGA